MCLDVVFAAELSAVVTGARKALPQTIAAHCRGIVNARKSQTIDPVIGWFQGNQCVKFLLSCLTASDCCHSEDLAGLEDSSSRVSQEFIAWSNERGGTK